MTALRIEARVGAYASETHFAPTTGPVYHAFQWNAQDAAGNKLPSGAYPVLVTAHVAEGAFIAGTNIAVNRDIETAITAEGVVPILNNRESPFGAGWWLDELDRLFVDATGTVMWAHGDGTTAVFSPGLAAQVVAGGAVAGFSGDGGPARQATFNTVHDLAFDAHGNLFVLDRGNVRVRRIDPAGNISTQAGNGLSAQGTDGVLASQSSLDNPTALAVGPDGSVYIAEEGRDPVFFTTQTRIRKVDPTGMITTIIAGTGMSVIPPIRRLVFDSRTDSFLALTFNKVVRVSGDGAVTRMAGGELSGFAGDDGLAVDALLNEPTGIALDAQGNLYIVDTGNLRIRQVDPAGIIRTFAGTGRLPTSLQESVPAALADIRPGPGAGLAITPAGDLILAETFTRVIRRINANGTIRTIAGKSASGADPLLSGSAMDVAIGPPRVVAVGPGGQIAFCSNTTPPFPFDDSSTTEPNHYVRMLNPSLGGESPYLASPGRFEKLVRLANGSFERRDREGSVHRYAPDGKKTSWKDRRNNETRYGYTGELLSSITEPTGEVWTFTYGGNRKLTRVADHTGRETVFAVDASGDLATITDPDQAAVTYTYDSAHRMTKRTTALGFPFKATYSPKGQVSRTDYADGATRRFVPQDSRGLVEDIPAGLGTFCQPAPIVRPETVVATYIDGRAKPWTYKLDRFRLPLKEVDPLGRTTLYERDANGLVKRMVRPNASEVLTTYGSRGEVLREEDTGIPGDAGRGATSSSTYASALAITTSTVDPLGNRTVTELDAAGNPVKVTDPAGFTVIRAFNARGQPTSETDRNGHETTLAYTASGNTSLITHPGGATRRMTYTPAGYVDTVTDENGHDTRITYTPYGLTASQINARNDARTMTYDADRRLVELVDEEGRRTAMAYDRRDRLIRTESPSGRVVTRSYDLEGLLVSSTDPKLRITLQEFDDARQLTSRTQPGDVVSQFFYGSPDGCTSCSGSGGVLGLVTRTIDPEGSETHFSHDPSGRTTQVIDAIGGRTRFTLDRVGNILRREDPDGQSVQTFFDSRYRPQFTIDPRTGSTERLFDGNGNIIREYNGRRDVTEREFDERNRLIRITVAAGTTAASTTRFGYDNQSNLTKLTTPRGKTWLFEHDDLDRLIRETDPLNRSTLFEYDKVGNLTKMTDRTGQVTRYRHNSENEKIEITYHNGAVVTLDRDPQTGQTTRIADNTVAVERTYDHLDRLATESIPLLSRSVILEYNKASDRTALAINGARTAYEFDPLHRLKKLVHGSGAVAEWEYDPIGLVTAKKLPNGITAAMTYNQRRLTQMTYRNAQLTPLASFSYEHDPIANIIRMTDNDGQHVYSYDGQSRLVSATYPVAPANPAAVTNEQFTFDGSGNRIERTFSSGAFDIGTEYSSYDDADQIVQTVRPYPPPPCPPGTPPEQCPAGRPPDVTDYASDANGAMTKVVATSKPLGSLAPTVITTEFTYDARQRMTRVKLNDGRVENFDYYPNSPLRLSFTAPGTAPSGGAKTLQLWEPLTGNPLQDIDGANALLVDYVMGNDIDVPLGRVAGGATYTFVNDHLGSVRGLADPAGSLVNQYTYAAFGAGRSQVEVAANRLRFTARELDGATGLQYTRHRNYAPTLGRWTQKDPIGFDGGINIYLYTSGDPINYIDPLGLACVCANLKKGESRIVDVQHKATVTNSFTAQFTDKCTLFDLSPGDVWDLIGRPLEFDLLVTETLQETTTTTMHVWYGSLVGHKAVQLTCGKIGWIPCKGPCVRFSTTKQHDSSFETKNECKLHR